MHLLSHTCQRHLHRASLLTMASTRDDLHGWCHVILRLCLQHWLLHETAGYIKGQSWNFCSTGCHDAITLTTRTTPWRHENITSAAVLGRNGFQFSCKAVQLFKPFSIVTGSALIKAVPTGLVDAWITTHVLLKGKNWNLTRPSFVVGKRKLSTRACWSWGSVSALRWALGWRIHERSEVACCSAGRTFPLRYSANTKETRKDTVMISKATWNKKKKNNNNAHFQPTWQQGNQATLNARGPCVQKNVLTISYAGLTSLSRGNGNVSFWALVKHEHQLGMPGINHWAEPTPRAHDLTMHEKPGSIFSGHISLRCRSCAYLNVVWECCWQEARALGLLVATGSVILCLLRCCRPSWQATHTAGKCDNRFHRK